VLGIECVGVVDDAGGSDLAAGQTVAALMGEMGRAYDGGYAEYTLVPRESNRVRARDLLLVSVPVC
jgi:NADPH:quinone reductase-like Zn-dependent oxidoreductase